MSENRFTVNGALRNIPKRTTKLTHVEWKLKQLFNVRFVKRRWKLVNRVARELCFRIMIPTEKQWSAYTWNCCAVMKNRISDSSPEISKVNWILNFSQAPYHSDGFNRRNRLYIHIVRRSPFFLYRYFLYGGIKKLQSIPLLALWYSMRFLFARAYIPELEYRWYRTYQLTRSILVIYLPCFVTSRYKLCQANRVFPWCSAIQYQIFREHETSVLFRV